MESEEAKEARVHRAECQRGEGYIQREFGAVQMVWSPQAFSKALINICM